MRVCSWVTWEWEPQPQTLPAPRNCGLWQQEVWSLELGNGEAERGWVDEPAADMSGWGGLGGRGGERPLVEVLEEVVLVGMGWAVAISV